MARRKHSILVLGGARSGKSAYAENLGRACHATPVYIATAEALDTEMSERIAEHRSRRGAAWRTVDAAMDLTSALKENAEDGGFMLVDCITIWLSNLMHAEQDTGQAVEELCDMIPTLPGVCVFVSNEVGLGIVPENALARRFRDEAGRANQRLAQACNEVVLVTAGLPMKLKS